MISDFAQKLRAAVRQDGAHPVYMIALNGERKPYGAEGMVARFVTQPYLIAAFVFAGILGLAGATFLGSNLSPTVAFILWFFAVYLCVLIWGIQSFFLEWLSARSDRSIAIRSVWLHMVPNSFLISSVYFFSNIWHELAGQELAIKFATEFARLLLLSMMFELLIVKFVDPIWLQRLNATSTDNGSEPSNAYITVNDSKIQVSEIFYLKSEEHYVEFILQDSAPLIRIRLRDVIAQLSETQGVQPHRSYWVAKTAIKSTIKSNGSCFLILHDDTKIPVARHRKDEVSDWLAKHLDM